jgi:hypothetical protein
VVRALQVPGLMPGSEPSRASEILRLARQDAADTATQALALAGAVVAERPLSHHALVLRQTLLREALIATAQALSGNSTLRSLADATAALDSQVAQVPLALGPLLEKSTADVLVEGAEPQAETLRRAECSIARLLQSARSGRHVGWEARRSRGSVVATVGLIVAIIAVVGTVPLWYRPAAQTFRWHASSALSGFKDSGTLGELQAYDLQFHTNEESAPWVVVDMRTTRTIDRVVLRNRTECCRDRGVPLVVEVGLDEEHFEVVAERTEAFDIWTAHFTAQPARYVRVRSRGTTVLHLRRIEIP